MFGTVNKGKSQFLETRRAIREERAFEKDREEAACKIQAQYRGYRARLAIKKEIRSTVDEILKIPPSCEEDYIATLRPALEVYNIIKKFLFIYHEKDDQQRYEYLCRYLLASMDSDNVKLSYVFVALQKDQVLAWIQQIKDILWRCVSQLRVLKPENHQDQKRIMVCLRLLVAFTHTATWKILKGKGGEALTPGMNQLCSNIMGYLNSKGLYPVLQILLTKGLARNKPVFNKATLSAIITISLRPLLAANFSDNLLSVFILHILSVPAVIYHVNSIAPDCMTLLISNRVFRRSLDLLVNEQSTRIIFNSLEGNYALCLLGK
ncbi:hypothetical protein CHS0354_023434 [Potamilus streckersoni]|uniref:HECT-type E3 ubiquitin transferase n=1 Tax=Potamilus streckersoni TaxID=2493646 RepID=A0AAE0RYN2_9BIVA|nr:hypothetical protein CHS0354_023434 [Potamilus streckersoni]